MIYYAILKIYPQKTRSSSRWNFSSGSLAVKELAISSRGCVGQVDAEKLAQRSSVAAWSVKGGTSKNHSPTVWVLVWLEVSSASFKVPLLCLMGIIHWDEGKACLKARFSRVRVRHYYHKRLHTLSLKIVTDKKNDWIAKALSVMALNVTPRSLLFVARIFRVFRKTRKTPLP